jgi:hypothetical protein
MTCPVMDPCGHPLAVSAREPLRGLHGLVSASLVSEPLAGEHWEPLLVETFRKNVPRSVCEESAELVGCRAG